MAIMHRRVRLILLSVLAGVVALLVAAVIAVYVLLQPQRITDLLRHEARQAGLTLSVSTPARPSLWPQPSLVLHGLTLSSDNRPVLVVARARVVVPWRALLGGPIAITKLELDGPRLDLAQLGQVVSRMGHGGVVQAKLPRIHTGIRIRQGSLTQSGKLLLDDINLKTGALSPDQVFKLRLAATMGKQPFTLALSTTPHETGDAIEFKHVKITLNAPQRGKGRLAGHARWRGGEDIRMTLHGRFIDTDKQAYASTLELVPGAGQKPATLDVTVTGPGLASHFNVPMSDVASWWRQTRAGGTLSLPPVDGTITAKKVDMAGVHIEGLHVSAGSAAAASSGSAPASSSTTVTP
jgi:AsmA protein